MKEAKVRKECKLKNIYCNNQMSKSTSSTLDKSMTADTTAIDFYQQMRKKLIPVQKFEDRNSIQANFYQVKSTNQSTEEKINELNPTIELIHPYYQPVLKTAHKNYNTGLPVIDM